MTGSLKRPININGFGENDQISVTSKKHGSVRIVVTGEFGKKKIYNLTAQEAERAVINGGRGNNVICIGSGINWDQKINVTFGYNMLTI